MVGNEHIAPAATPRRRDGSPSSRIAHEHTVVQEAIARNLNIEVHTLTNCDRCQTEIANGSIGVHELHIPGLTKANIIRGPNQRANRETYLKVPDKKDESPRK